MNVRDVNRDPLLADLATVRFEKREAPVEGEVVLIPSARQGLKYGVVSGSSTEVTKCLSDPGSTAVVHHQLLFLVKCASGLTVKMPAPAIGRLLPVDAAMALTRQQVDEADFQAATRTVGRHATIRDLKLLQFFFFPNHFEPGELVLLPRSSGGFTYGMVAAANVRPGLCSRGTADEHPVTQYRVLLDPDGQTKKDVFASRIGKLPVAIEKPTPHSLAVHDVMTSLPLQKHTQQQQKQHRNRNHQKNTKQHNNHHHHHPQNHHQHHHHHHDNHRRHQQELNRNGQEQGPSSPVVLVVDTNVFLSASTFTLLKMMALERSCASSGMEVMRIWIPAIVLRELDNIKVKRSGFNQAQDDEADCDPERSRRRRVAAQHANKWILSELQNPKSVVRVPLDRHESRAVEHFYQVRYSAAEPKADDVIRCWTLQVVADEDRPVVLLTDDVNLQVTSVQHGLMAIGPEAFFYGQGLPQKQKPAAPPASPTAADAASPAAADAASPAAAAAAAAAASHVAASLAAAPEVTAARGVTVASSVSEPIMPTELPPRPPANWL